MSDLSEYFSDKDEIARLNKQVRLLQQNNSKWKAKYYSIVKAKPRVSRTAAARVLVKAWQDGDESLTLHQIAVKSYLSYATIKEVSSKLRAA